MSSVIRLIAAAFGTLDGKFIHRIEIAAVFVVVATAADDDDDIQHVCMHTNFHLYKVSRNLRYPKKFTMKFFFCDIVNGYWTCMRLRLHCVSVFVYGAYSILFASVLRLPSLFLPLFCLYFHIFNDFYISFASSARQSVYSNAVERFR